MASGRNRHPMFVTVASESLVEVDVINYEQHSVIAVGRDGFQRLRLAHVRLYQIQVIGGKRSRFIGQSNVDGKNGFAGGPAAAKVSPTHGVQALLNVVCYG